VALLAFVEGASRFFLYRVFDYLNNGDSVSWRIRWIRGHRRHPSLAYSSDVHHRIRGWTLKPNLHDLPEFGAAGHVDSNAAGLRARREYLAPKPASVTRILVFGDSFTFGDEVEDFETYSAVLEGLLPGVEVINVGVHGYGHDQMLLYLEEVGAHYQPDVVLLGFVDLDMERNLLTFRDFAKPWFTAVDGRLLLHGVPVPTPRMVRAREPWHSSFLDVLSLLASEWGRRSGRRDTAKNAVTAAILEEFRRTTVRLGALPVFVYLPIEGELEWPDQPANAAQLFFRRFVQEHGIRGLDLRPSFLARARAGSQFRTVGHWGPLEHRTAAEGIAAYLVDEGVVSARR
jgi:hypothetical protein